MKRDNNKDELKQTKEEEKMSYYTAMIHKAT